MRPKEGPLSPRRALLVPSHPLHPFLPSHFLGCRTYPFAIAPPRWRGGGGKQVVSPRLFAQPPPRATLQALVGWVMILIFTYLDLFDSLFSLLRGWLEDSPVVPICCFSPICCRECTPTFFPSLSDSLPFRFFFFGGVVWRALGCALPTFSRW